MDYELVDPFQAGLDRDLEGTEQAEEQAGPQSDPREENISAEHDLFSQILGDYYSPVAQNEGFSSIPASANHPHGSSDHLLGEEAGFTKRKGRRVFQSEILPEIVSVLMSIEDVHEPFSCTAPIALFNHKRGLKKNKRTNVGFSWPAHPEDFNQSHLMAKTVASEPFDVAKEQTVVLNGTFGLPTPETNMKNGEAHLRPGLRVSCAFFREKGDSTDAADEKHLNFLKAHEDLLEREGGRLCPLEQSIELNLALQRAAAAIWRSKSTSKSTSTGSSEIDPVYAAAVARRTAHLLQAVFDQVIVFRRSALSLIRQRHDREKLVKIKNRARKYGDLIIEDTPANWKSVRNAAKRLIRQAGLSQDIFTAFSERISSLFHNQ